MDRNITQILELLRKPNPEVEALTKNSQDLLNSKKSRGKEEEDQQSTVGDPSPLVQDTIKEKGSYG